MKKYLALTLTILSIMCFIAVISAQGLQNYKLKQGYVPANSKEVVVKDISLEAMNTSESEKSDDSINITNSLKHQEKDPIGMSLDEAIVQHTQKASINATENKTVRQIDPQKPMVALTFDDGPHSKYTMKILASLKKYNGLATFFVLGNRAEKYKNVIKSINESGNQIGNHTYDHKELTKLGGKAITSEVSKTNNILQNITNIKPSLIRPTYGSVNKNVKLYSGAPLILWSIDTLDWKTRNEKMIVNEVLGNVKDGDIILMHDIYETTAMAAEVVIKELSSKGYQLVTIDELFTAKGIDLVNGKVYGNAYKTNIHKK
ncbi:MAG: polysaccharide deacetylase family protein [Ruminiclostridium sp.]